MHAAWRVECTSARERAKGRTKLNLLSASTRYPRQHRLSTMTYCHISVYSVSNYITCMRFLAIYARLARTFIGRRACLARPSPLPRQGASFEPTLGHGGEWVWLFSPHETQTPLPSRPAQMETPEMRALYTVVQVHTTCMDTFSKSFDKERIVT